MCWRQPDYFDGPPSHPRRVSDLSGEEFDAMYEQFQRGNSRTRRSRRRVQRVRGCDKYIRSASDVQREVLRVHTRIKRWTTAVRQALIHAIDGPPGPPRCTSTVTPCAGISPGDDGVNPS